MLKPSHRSDFKGLYTRRHFVWPDDPEDSWSEVWTFHFKAQGAAADSDRSISEELAECGF